MIRTPVGVTPELMILLDCCPVFPHRSKPPTLILCRRSKHPPNGAPAFPCRRGILLPTSDHANSTRFLFAGADYWPA